MFTLFFLLAIAAVFGIGFLIKLFLLLGVVAFFAAAFGDK